MIKNQWYAVLSSRQLKYGKMVAAKRLGMDLVFFRDSAGRAHALLDLCPHRGAKISKGEVKGDTVMCPFHGIQYNGQGKATLIPANGKEDVEDLKRFNVKTFPVIERFELIYVWYGDAEPTNGDEISYFPEILELGGIMTETFDSWKTHYTRTIENQLDVAHLPFVHHNTIGRGGKTLVNGPKVIWDDDNQFQHSADNEVDKGQTPKPSKEARIGDTYMRFRFPNIWLNNISDKFKIVGVFIPVDDENMILNLRSYIKITGISFIDKLIGLIMNRANLVVAHQDRPIVETERPKRTSLMMGETLLRADRPIVEYRRRREELIKAAEQPDKNPEDTEKSAQ